MTEESTQKSRRSVSTQRAISCDSRSGDFAYESSKNLQGDREASDWCQNLASGVAFQRMLTELLQHPPKGSQDFALYSSFSGSFSQQPDVGRCRAFADVANSILLRYYSTYPPTVQQPAIMFLPISKATLGEGDPGSRILVVLREQWDRIRLEHTQQQTKGGCLDPATQVPPPWDIVIAVVEFGREEVPAPYTTPSPPIGSSISQDTCDDRGRKRSRPASEDLSPPPPTKVRRVGSPSSPLKPSPEAQKEYSPVEEFLTQSSPRISIDEKHLSPIRPDPEAGLLGCFHQLLTGAAYRGWTSGAIIEAHQITLVSCDRGGLVQSSPVDMRSPEGFQLLCDWVLTLGSRTMEQWGFINLFGDVGKPVQDAEFDVPLTSLHLSFGRMQYRQHGIFGRCTNVYDVAVRSGDTNIDGICKIAWPLSSRPNEHELGKVHAIDPVHTPDVHCAWDVFMELPSKRLRPHCANASPIEDRTMRVTVMTKYQLIDNLEGDDFLAAFTQIMQCNVRLYEAGCVHHRDLSPSNMMYHRDATGRIIGVLTDFDLAVPLDELMQDEAPQKLHGTAPFMPYDLQHGKASEHTLNHDFESALYMMAWVAMGYKCGKPPLDVGDPLRRWREGSWKDIAEYKLRFLNGQDVYPKVVKDIRPEYKCLLKPIQELKNQVLVHIYGEILQKLLGPEVPPFMPPFGPSQFFEYLAAK